MRLSFSAHALVRLVQEETLTRMDTIINAPQLLTTGQSALVIFTRGGHFHLDENDKTGSSGNWVIRPVVMCDKVIIYLRQSDANRVYIADFVGTRCSNEDKRHIVLFRNTHLAGMTASNWRQFANGSQQPAQRIVKDATR